MVLVDAVVGDAVLLEVEREVLLLLLGMYGAAPTSSEGEATVVVRVAVKCLPVLDEVAVAVVARPHGSGCSTDGSTVEDEVAVSSSDDVSWDPVSSSSPSEALSSADGGDLYKGVAADGEGIGRGASSPSLPSSLANFGKCVDRQLENASWFDSQGSKLCTKVCSRAYSPNSPATLAASGTDRRSWRMPVTRSRAPAFVGTGQGGRRGS